jgi:uncharacterized protein YbjT (DUF2867 family)
MAIKNVMLIGAGGNLGPHILKSLLDAGFHVTILSRNSSKSTFPATAKVAQIDDEYPYEALVEAFKGQDAVVSTIGGMALSTQKRMIDAAVAAGIHRFIPTEFGSVPEGEDAENPVFGGKREIREYLETKKGQGLTWTGIANGFFFEWGIETGFLRVDIPNKKATILDQGDARGPSSTWRTIASATAGALQNPEATANRMVFVQSFWISPNDIIRAVEKATGSQFEVTKLDRKTFVPDQEAKLQQGDMSALYGIVWSHATSGEDWNAKLDNKLLGVPEEDLDTVVGQVVKNITKS